jgi:hypothetical protein
MVDSLSFRSALRAAKVFRIFAGLCVRYYGLC